MTSSPKPAESNEEQTDGLPPFAPDFVEQDHPELIDQAVPTRGYHTTPMVGLGGSAGGIQALTEFFKAMPPDTGMVFVVVLHLSPKHQSTLPELLGRSTKMPVVQAQDHQKVEPNHVYVIPPGKYLVTVNGYLKLADIDDGRGKRVAVDLFFRSLADTHGPHAAAIVLSGVDGDGALGIKRIKERGGLTIAQDPEQAEYAGMPRASIETGMIDWVLDVPRMPGRLVEYHQNGMRLKLPPEEFPTAAPSRQATVDDAETALRDVLVFLRMRTGRDFSSYKRATILRRVARRMQVNGVDDLPAYLSFLRTHPGEAGALLKDLLISVTNFFRDRDVFEALKAHIPHLFKNKTQNDSVRIWVPACATGEEAYSLAMLLLEHARSIEAPPTIQVFACDIDEEAIQMARSGHYPEVITADVSEERLRRFFLKDHRGYRVRRELRELVLFAVHDILKDPPFSRMDLISCRNLLIYLNRTAQQAVEEMFHFALRPDGRLLLGSSETLEDGHPLFRVLDKKYRIFARQPAVRVALPLSSATSSLFRVMEAQAQAQAQGEPVVHGKRFLQDAAVPFQGKLFVNHDRAALANIHFRLIERYAPPSVIVNGEHEIMHLSEHAGNLLKFIGGEPTASLLRVIKPELRVELRTALFRAAETGTTIETSAVPAEIDGRVCTVTMRISPAQDIAPGFLLVTFQKGEVLAEPPTQPVSSERSDTEPHAQNLERELEQVKTHLRDTVEQYEASTEELKASNEELQAMNEELRSATEELETSREELQSINEELTTVNSEMKSKVDELAGANSDLQNLMASTSIATVFLDRTMSITRYTPSAAGIFNMIPSDVGRPLEHLKHKLDYPDLIADAERVLSTLVPIEREVREESRWYLARFQPYRTLEDHIAGAVLTLVDVTERNRAMEALRQSEERLRLLIESAQEFAIFTLDRDGRVDSWNKGAEAVFGYSEPEIIGQLSDTLFRDKGEPLLEQQKAVDIGRAETKGWHVRKDGSTLYGQGSVLALRNASGELRGFVKIIHDLTETKRSEDAQSQQRDELTRITTATVGREARMIELKKEVNELCTRLGEKPRYQQADLGADARETPKS